MFSDCDIAWGIGCGLVSLDRASGRVLLWVAGTRWKSEKNRRLAPRR
jgi:hypothetical protein